MKIYDILFYGFFLNNEILLNISFVIHDVWFYEFVVKDERLHNTNILPVLCIYHFQILCTVEKLGISDCRGPPLAILQCSSLFGSLHRSTSAVKRICMHMDIV